MAADIQVGYARGWTLQAQVRAGPAVTAPRCKLRRSRLDVHRSCFVAAVGAAVAWSSKFSRRTSRISGVAVRSAVVALRAQTSVGDESFDVVVIGAGFGGLSCAGMLALAGRKVALCESHAVPGGVAHSFTRGGYEFDSGPSLLSGMSAPSTPNPLRHVLNALGEDCDWVTYDGWRMVTPDGDFDFKVGDEAHWAQILRRFGGAQALEEWNRLIAAAVPLGEASQAIPPAALRGDLSVVRTLMRYFPRLPRLLLNGPRFQAPFVDLMRGAGVTSPFLRQWLDYICFVLQALPADQHPTAPVAYMLADMHKPNAKLDYPRGGMGALIEAMARGAEKHGVKIRYGAHVEQIILNSAGRATGVRLRNGSVLTATEAVVSNASVWDTMALLPPEAQQKREAKLTPSGSFMHLHLGLRKEALPKDMTLHYSVIRDWKEPIDATANVVIISVPSVVNPALAPPDRHCLHAYLAATEPYDVWKGLKRGSPEYEAFKKERAKPLFEAVERAVPGASESIELELIGSPLTHARFNRRHLGTYGPLFPASAGMLPGPRTHVEGLLCCGDSTFPGIGVPAAAASGCAAANALLSVDEHLMVLDAMKIP